MHSLRLLILGHEPAAASLTGPLARLGYELVAHTTEVGQVATLARRGHAHLILIGQALAGPREETAHAIQDETNLPVVVIIDRELPPAATGPGTPPILPGLVLPAAAADLQRVVRFALQAHRADRTIQTQAEQIQAMQLATTDTFWLVDARGFIRDCNDAAGRLTGYTRAELVGMSLHQLGPTHPPDQLAASLVAAGAGVSPTIEREWRRRDGSTCTVELSLRGLPGPGRLICGFAHDITARQAAIHRFRQLTRAVEHCPAAIVITDTRGTIQYVNPYFEKVTGYTATEAVGLNPRVLKSGTQDAAFYRDLWATLQRGDTWSGDFHNRRKDGTTFWEKASISPMRDTDGTITHFVAVKEDVTAARQARLDLVRARDEAEAASRAKDSFLAAMSHELRTPLNVINGTAGTLLAESLPARVREALTLSLQSGQHLLAIIEEILDFSALQSGKVQLEAVPMDLIPLLDEVLRQVAELPGAKPLTLTLTVDPAVPAQISGDARRLRQVLLNLLANAIKFTATGAVHLTIRPQLGSPARPGLHCAVIDTGPGIAAAHREIIFQPFTQADPSIARRYGGTGLGLAISRSFVELMGGQLRVRSRPGRGSAFHFTFAGEPVAPTRPANARPARIRRRPVAAASQPASPKLVAPAPASGPASWAGTLAKEIPLTVLAADDVQTNRYVVEMVLNHLGYPCQLVNDGAEAVDALKSAYYDLVLLDVQMPVMNGLEAAAAICRLYPDPTHRPKLVALTANALPANRAACLAAGMDEFLTKPLLPPALIACIRKLFPTMTTPPLSAPSAPSVEPVAPEWINTFQLRTLTLGLTDDARAGILLNMHAFTRDDYRTAFVQVQTACTARDAAELRTVVHGLKGCFLTLGWDRAAGLCRETIAAIQAGTFADWSTFPAELQRRYETSDAAMTELLAGPFPPNPTDHARL